MCYCLKVFKINDVFGSSFIAFYRKYCFALTLEINPLYDYSIFDSKSSLAIIKIINHAKPPYTYQLKIAER